MKTCAMFRVGGLGDILILTPIAKALYRKGYKVDFFCGSPTGKVYELIEGLPYLNSVREVVRVNGIDCIKDGENFISVEMLKPLYDEIFDYKYSIEDNNAGLNKKEAWRISINSNYQNWVDLSLSWANIDPTKILDLDKRPEISFIDSPISDNSILSKYEQWVLEKTPIVSRKTERNYNVIGIQLQASSLIRTWYRSADLPELIHKKYPNDIVIIFSNKWVCITPNGRQEINIPEGYNPLCCSAALISEMNCFISADSGSSHIGEAVSTPTIGVYTTVPAWTRAKYYRYSHYLEANPECFPCFTLHAFCPIEKKKAEDSLSEREKDIIEGANKNLNPMDFATKYNVPPKAVEMEYNSAMQRLQALSSTEPACVKSITAEMILDKIDEVLTGVNQSPKLKILNFNEKIEMENING
jgi:ADP-heptose:LPS heptosyltransferase